MRILWIITMCLALGACQLPIPEPLDPKMLNPDVKEATDNQIQKAVTANWVYSEGELIPSQTLVVSIAVESNKMIRSVDVKQTSGNASFDASLSRAVRKSQPLPIPSEILPYYRQFEMVFDPSKYRRVGTK